MKTKYIRLPLLLVAFCFLFSCSSDDDKGGDDDNTNTPSPLVLVLGTEYNSYLFPNVQSFDKGVFDSKKLSKTSIQMNGDRRLHFYKDQYMYAFVYNRNDPGKSTSFEYKNNTVSQRNEYDFDHSIQARTDFKNTIVGVYSDRECAPEYGTPEYEQGLKIDTYIYFYKFDVNTDAVSKAISFHSNNFDGNDEMAYVTCMKEYGDYLLVGLRSMKGYLEPGVFPDTALLFNTDHSNKTYLAIFDKDFKLLKLIKDYDRTGIIGGMIKATGNTGIEVLDNGDVYAFCSAENSTDRPSGVLKVDMNTREFDPNYFININELSGNHKLFRVHYLGGTKFCLQLFNAYGLDTSKFSSLEMVASKLAILDISINQLDIVSGAPDNVESITDPYIDREAQKIYFGINQTNKDISVYAVDIESKTMSKTLKIEGESIRGLGKLTEK